MRDGKSQNVYSDMKSTLTNLLRQIEAPRNACVAIAFHALHAIKLLGNFPNQEQ